MSVVWAVSRGLLLASFLDDQLLHSPPQSCRRSTPFSGTWFPHVVVIHECCNSFPVYNFAGFPLLWRLWSTSVICQILWEFTCRICLVPWRGRPAERLLRGWATCNTGAFHVPRQKLVVRGRFLEAGLMSHGSPRKQTVPSRLPPLSSLGLFIFPLHSFLVCSSFPS